MTSNILYFLFIMAFLDCLNPATIITQLLLLIKTRSSQFSFFFTVSTYVTYLAAGTLLFFGVATPLKKWLSSIRITPNIWTVTMEIILITLGIIYLWWSFSKKKDKSKSLIQNLTAWGVVILGIGSTLSDVPTAIPYFTFIARMEQENMTMLSSILLFSLYTFIYVSPLLVIHLLFIKNQFYIIKNSAKIKRWIDLIGKWVIRLLILAVITFLSIDVVRYFQNE